MNGRPPKPPEVPPCPRGDAVIHRTLSAKDARGAPLKNTPLGIRSCQKGITRVLVPHLLRTRDVPKKKYHAAARNQEGS